jgi:hypothetical protein
MQIRRFDHEPHAYADPQGPVRSAGEQGGASAANSVGSRTDQSTPRTDRSDAQLASLIERFRSVPEIRSDAVEAAREKVARGDFTTRQAAEQLAATDLRNQYF